MCGPKSCAWICFAITLVITVASIVIMALWWSSWSNLSACSQAGGLQGITSSCGFSCITTASNSTSTTCNWCFASGDLNNPAINTQTECTSPGWVTSPGFNCAANSAYGCQICLGGVVGGNGPNAFAQCTALATTESLSTVFGLTANLIVASVFSAIAGICILILICVMVSVCCLNNSSTGSVGAPATAVVISGTTGQQYAYTYAPAVGVNPNTNANAGGQPANYANSSNNKAVAV